MDKPAIRNKFKQIRQSIKPECRTQWDHEITKGVKALPEVQQAKCLFAYLSRASEVSTKELVKALLEAGKSVLTPSPDIKALPHDGLFRVHLEDPTCLTDPVFCTESRVEHVDVILVPGIAWDSSGYRIGFGGGYFDRLLAMARPDAVAIGLAYSCQLTDAIPVESWDKPVDILVTEKQLLRIT